MANTTNFNWETPDDTDLVKDGAAAIRTLGSSIDTSFVDLKGGTTGQVLSKASNTDLDYSWVTTDDANAIQNAIVDAKGDLIAASAADTPARLAVGNNGETLVADSSTSTGLRYQEPKAGNPVINSGFQVWQRGTSVAGAGGGAYTADRWMLYAGGQGTVSRQATGDTTNLANVQYCARVQRNNASSDTTVIPFGQSFETVNSIPFAGKTVTLSFYARKGANYSSASDALSVTLATGTGTDQNFLSAGYTGSATPISQTATLTATWQRFSYSATLSSSLTELAIRFQFTPVGTAGAADYFEVTGVQLEVGSVATPFKTYAATLAGELAACQRYYWRNTSVGNASNFYCYGLGTAYSGTRAAVFFQHPITMRTAPSFAHSGSIQIVQGSTGNAISAISIDNNSSTQTLLNVTTSSLTTGYANQMTSSNNTTSFIELSAEL